MKILKKWFVISIGVLCMMMVSSNHCTVYGASDETNVSINKTTFPDDNFRAYVKTLPGGEDGVFTPKELAAIKDLTYCGTHGKNKKLKNITGIEYFTALESIDVQENNLKELNLEKQPFLKKVECYNNQLTTLHVPSEKLEYLSCINNKIKHLTICSKVVQHVDCSSNQLTSITIQSPRLEELICSFNNIAKMDVDMTSLHALECNENALTVLSLDAPKLAYLDCSENKLSNLNCTSKKLYKVIAYDNKLTTLTMDSTIIEVLDVAKNQLKEINLNSEVLQNLNCAENQLTTLEINYPNLTRLNCRNNQLVKLSANCPSLESLNCAYNKLSEISLEYPNLELLFCHHNNVSNLDISKLHNLLLLDACCNNIKQIDTSKNFMIEEIYYVPSVIEMDVRKNFDYTKVPTMAEFMFMYEDEYDIETENLKWDRKHHSVSLLNNKNSGSLKLSDNSTEYKFVFTCDQEANDNVIPATGDQTNRFYLYGACIVAASLLLFLIKKRRTMK